MSFTGQSIYVSGEPSTWCEDERVLSHLETIKSNMQNDEKTFLHLNKLTLTAPLTLSLIDLVARKQSKLTKLLVSECTDNEQLAYFIRSVGGTFDKIILSDIREMDDPLAGKNANGAKYRLKYRECSDLFKALIEVFEKQQGEEGEGKVNPNKVTTHLELREMTLNLDQVKSLRRCLSLKECPLKILRLGAVQFTDAEDGAIVLSQGLAFNESLEALQLVRCRLSDQHVALVAKALSGHPKLYELDLTGNNCRKEGLAALSTLLSRSECKIGTLKLNDQFYTYTLPSSSSSSSSSFSSTPTALPPFEPNEAVFLESLRRNKSLRHLELSRNQLDDVDPLLSILWDCPNLKVLSLLGNRITRLSSWRRFWLQTRPSRLRRLDLSYNPFQYGSAESSDAVSEERTTEWLCRLVKAHPELHDVSGKQSHRLLFNSARRGEVDGGGSCKKESQVFQHYLDLNKAGRTLIANNSIPLSLWPHVLERTRRMFDPNGDIDLTKQRQANVIFHLLNGPVTVSK